MGLPRVWLAPLSEDWSYDFTARALRQHLSDRFEIRIAYDRKELDAWPADLYVDLWWGSNLHRRFGPRCIKQVSSHRWSQPRYARLDVKRLVGKYLAGSSGVMVPSLRLRDELEAAERNNMPPIAIGPKGFHPELMGDYGLRRGGGLEVGWAGNADAADKNVDMVLKACPGTRLADRCLRQSEMSDFYNSVDVITCMSRAEGDPRTLIEGMACGCFPVTVDVGIVPELVKHEVNGLVIKRTPEALAAALAWCSDNLGFVRDAGRKNAAQMLATRTWAQMAVPWGDAFDAALERAAAAPPFEPPVDSERPASRSVRRALARAANARAGG